MYGGTRYEPDAQCSAYIHSGGDVPEKYYFTNQKEASKEDMKRVVVGRGSSHKVSCVHEMQFVAMKGSFVVMIVWLENLSVSPFLFNSY